MISARERRWVRFLIIAVGVGFVAHFRFAHNVDDPFPSNTMPRFRYSSGHRGDRIRRMSREIAFGFRDGSSAVVAQRELLRRTFPVGGHNEFMRFFCDAPPVPEIPDWMLRVLPRHRWGRRHRDGPAALASLRKWARREAGVLFPDRGAVWLECRFVWNVYRFGSNGGLERERKHDDARRWDLRP